MDDSEPNDRRMAEDERAFRIYEFAQQSAEHSDTMLWEVTYIIWGATTLLLGFVLEGIRKESFLELMTALLSIFLSIMVLRFAMLYRRVRNRKYQVCKEIEDVLQMKWRQHTDTKDYSPGEQTRWYWVTTFIFIFVWSLVAVRSGYLMYVYHCQH